MAVADDREDDEEDRPKAPSLEKSWPYVGAQAVLCNLAKFPKINGQVVQVAGWNKEKQRWKCLLGNGGDVNVLAANLEPVTIPEERARAIEDALDAGRVFEAWQELLGHPFPPAKLKARLDAALQPFKSEVVDARVELVLVARRGMGYKAAKDIKQGDALLVDRALCHHRVAQSGCNQPGSPAPEEPLVDVLGKIKAGTLHHTAAPFMKVPKGGDMQRLVRVLETYTLQCSRAPGSFAMFPAAARFNHSCCPSAFADASEAECTIRALRDIPSGEEVTISYIAVAQALQLRRDKLQRCYGFHCDCPRCLEEERQDPHCQVPCKCTLASFTVDGRARMTQKCEKCGVLFDRERSAINVAQIAEANKKQPDTSKSDADRYEAVWAQLRRLSALVPLVERGAAHGVPPLHPEAILLVSNCASLHHHLAERFKGDQKLQALQAFHRHKRMAVERLQEAHGGLSNHRDLSFFQALHAVAHVEGAAEEEEQRRYQQKLLEACELCYGQPELPSSFLC